MGTVLKQIHLIESTCIIDDIVAAHIYELFFKIWDFETTFQYEKGTLSTVKGQRRSTSHQVNLVVRVYDRRWCISQIGGSLALFE